MGIFSRRKKKSTSGVDYTTSSAVLDAIRDSVIIIGPDGNTIYVNPAASTMTNFPTNATGLNYSAILHLVDKDGTPVEGAKDPIATALRTHTFVETKEFSIGKNRTPETTPVCLSITPTAPDQSGSYIIILRPITKELREERERSEFISTASHEMRNPVASIEGYLGLALSPQTATIDGRARSYLEKAHESSQHLGRLFRDLLDTSRLDDNRIKTKFIPVEMNALIKRIAGGMAPNVTAKGLAYDFGSSDARSDTNPYTRRVNQIIYCNLDVDYLREIIDNLINNAIKYTPSGSIAVSVVANKTDAIITVADTGIGISREHQNHIFQKFYRIDNSDTRNTEGTGLGLYIVKQRVEAMHGRVWVESEEGKGSKFFVSFPRISEEEYRRLEMVQTSTMQPTPISQIAPVATPIASPQPLMPTMPVAPQVVSIPQSYPLPQPASVSPQQLNSVTPIPIPNIPQQPAIQPGSQMPPNNLPTNIP